MRGWLRRLLNATGRFLAWRERRNAAVDPPLSGWVHRDLPPAVDGLGPHEPHVLRCSCGAPAAHDEVDLCHACRRRVAEVEAHAEESKRERNRRRREAARARARAKRGVLEMRRANAGGRG